MAAAKKLLAEAGYPDGFEVVMDCPNDRYVNDEDICQAVAQMLARIDVKVKLNAMPKAKYFEKVWPPSKYDCSFNLLGWTPGSLDSWNVLENIIGCRDADGKGGTFNFGGYCNPRMTELNKQILVETDTEKRDELIAEAFRLNHDEVGAHPAAPAVAGLGRVEEGAADGAARRQPDPLRLDEDAVETGAGSRGGGKPRRRLRSTHQSQSTCSPSPSAGCSRRPSSWWRWR